MKTLQNRKADLEMKAFQYSIFPWLSEVEAIFCYRLALAVDSAKIDRQLD